MYVVWKGYILFKGRVSFHHTGNRVIPLQGTETQALIDQLLSYNRSGVIMLLVTNVQMKQQLKVQKKC